MVTTQNRCPDDDCPGWFVHGVCNCCNRSQTSTLAAALIDFAIGGRWSALDLDNPDHRAQGYGMIIRARIHQAAATTAHLQLERHAYPGQPSHRTQPPTTADQVIGLADQLGITLQPWQQRAIRSLYPTPNTQPCRCWYTAHCCRILLELAVTNVLLGLPRACPVTGAHHLATGFMVNPHCPHHGNELSTHNNTNTPPPGA